MRSLMLTLFAVLVAACDSTPPHRFGALKSRITTGRAQSVVAGQIADSAVNLTFREQLAVAPAPLWEKWILPPLAFAQLSSNIQVQPGAVACISEDQTVLIPRARCVTADQNGQSRYDWLTTPTRVGTYCAHVASTYGTEITAADSVCVTISAGPVDANLSLNWGAMNSPAVLYASSVTDVYRNDIPFRIVSADTNLHVLGDTVGTAAARTVTFTNALVDTIAQAWRGPAELRGRGDTLLAKGYWRIGVDNQNPAIEWRIRGLSAPAP